MTNTNGPVRLYHTSYKHGEYEDVWSTENQEDFSFIAISTPGIWMSEEELKGKFEECLHIGFCNRRSEFTKFWQKFLETVK